MSLGAVKPGGCRLRERLRQTAPWVCFLLILGLATWLRLVRLGDSAFRSDEIEFLKVCRQTISGTHLFARWLDIMGRSAQFPFAMAFTKGFLNLVRLPASDFNVRLPAALWGIAAVGCSYLPGRAMAGRTFGLLLALAFALSPLHLQVSREAYFYPPLHLGAVLLTWSVLWAVRYRHKRGPFPIRFHALTAFGLFLAAYSHLSGWWLSLLASIVVFAVLMVRMVRTPREWRDLLILSALLLLIAVPLLFLPWAAPYFWHDLQHPEAKAHTAAVFAGVAPKSLSVMAWEAVTSLSWGNSMGRATLTILGLGSVLVLGLVQPRREIRIWVLVFLAIGGFVLFYMGHKVSALPFQVRYVAFLLGPFLLLLMVGLWRVSALPGLRRWRRRRLVAWALTLAALGAMVRPAWLCTHIRGKGKPYRDIVATIEASVPRGTLVLVDRWFEPWNELAIHNSTNVFFTFTVPNEPMEVCREVNWWQTAQDFLERFPDAAYLEVCNSYWTNELPWPWVTEQFAHHVSIDDPATRELAKIGLNYREHQVVHFHWNTLDDVLGKARAQGRPILALFGPGWGYAKLWQQMRGDFRDWRVMTHRAELHLYNLTDAPLEAGIRLEAAAVNGAKGIRASTGAWHTFPQGQVDRWTLEPFRLAPGKNVLELTDPNAPRKPTALLVSELRVEGTAAPTVSPRPSSQRDSLSLGRTDSSPVPSGPITIREP